MLTTVHITTAGGLAEAEGLRDRARDRLHRALARYGHAVRRADVHLHDVNGPRGGVDKRVRVTISGRRLGTVHLHEDGADVHATLDRAVRRLAFVVARSLDREQPRRERRSRRVRSGPEVS